MDKYTKLYRKLIALESKKVREGLTRFERYYYTYLMLKKDRIAKVKNPIVEIEINNELVFMQLAHDLPLFKARYRSYDKPIMIISKWLYKNKQRLNFVDVGANVGDTVVNIGIKEGNYLEIEGDNRYYEMIDKNLQGYQYELVKCFMTDEITGEQDVNVSYTAGHVLEKVDGNIRTLDDVLNSTGFEADIIKTDTDGYDLKVIRGGKGYIKKYHPFLFVEWYPQWLIENNQEDPQELFQIMNSLGYSKCILFDNFGVIQTILNTDDTVNLCIFEKYSLNKEKRIYYWDILFIPPQAGDCSSLIQECMDWEKYC